MINRIAKKNYVAASFAMFPSSMRTEVKELYKLLTGGTTHVYYNMVPVPIEEVLTRFAHALDAAQSRGTINSPSQKED